MEEVCYLVQRMPERDGDVTKVPYPKSTRLAFECVKSEDGQELLVYLDAGKEVLMDLHERLDRIIEYYDESIPLP